MDFIEGEILAFDKPYKWTSFDVVGKSRWLLCHYLNTKKLKVGHAGTLDPLATGVVVVCTGKKTKMIEKLQEGEKEYIATMQLGATTPSFDLEKEIDATYPTEHITREMIETALGKFRGQQQQVPPIFSAVKIDGKRAYDIARKGDSVELKPKTINISDITLTEFDPKTMQATIHVTCSKGTYIRALARDIGEELKSGAHLISLRRTRVGEYTIDRCIDFTEFESMLKDISTGVSKNSATTE